MKRKPCPFCGSTNLFGPSMTQPYIKCNDCWTYGPKPMHTLPLNMQWELKLSIMEDSWNQRKGETNDRPDES